jgi:hypothetical protein
MSASELALLLIGEVYQMGAVLPGNLHANAHASHQLLTLHLIYSHRDALRPRVPMRVRVLYLPVCHIANRDYNHQRQQRGHPNQVNQTFAFGL